MSDAAPFEVGQRVRMTAAARTVYPLMRVRDGTVRRCSRYRSADGSPSPWYVTVRRDGRKNAREFRAQFWEPVPPDDLSLDDTCAALVRAYHAGEPTAALGLAERIFELLGGTKRENAT